MGSNFGLGVQRCDSVRFELRDAGSNVVHLEAHMMHAPFGAFLQEI